VLVVDGDELVEGNGELGRVAQQLGHLIGGQPEQEDETQQTGHLWNQALVD
jgi:hypothetical protein